MRRILFLLGLIVFSPIINNGHLPFKQELHAGVISWGVKKIVGGLLNIIFSSAKDYAVEQAKIKLLNYIKKNPQYIDFVREKIQEQIRLKPQYKQRGIELLERLR